MGLLSVNLISENFIWYYRKCLNVGEISVNLNSRDLYSQTPKRWMQRHWTARLSIKWENVSDVIIKAPENLPELSTERDADWSIQHSSKLIHDIVTPKAYTSGNDGTLWTCWINEFDTSRKEKNQKWYKLQSNFPKSTKAIWDPRKLLNTKAKTSSRHSASCPTLAVNSVPLGS